MKLFTVFLSLNLIISNVALAEQKIISINEGEKAPFTGILFPKDQAEQNRYRLLEAETILRVNESLNTSLNLYKDNAKIDAEKYKNSSDQVINITKAYNDSKSLTNVERLIWFGFGVVASGLAVWAASKAIR